MKTSNIVSFVKLSARLSSLSLCLLLSLCLHNVQLASGQPAVQRRAMEGGVALPPRVNDEPIVIKVDFFVDHIGAINIRNMDYRIDYYLTESWDVPDTTCSTYIKRLKNANVNTSKDSGGSVFISPEHVHMIWWPDTFITNAKLIDMPSRVLSFSKMKITSRGKRCIMKHAWKLLALVSCQMELRNYPLDRQKCFLWMRSSELVRYEWRKTIQVNPKLRLSRYKLTSLKNGSIVKDDLTDRFSFLFVEFNFEREMAHNFIHTYAPSILLVALSWFSLWMGLDAVPGRITLSVTSLLALVTQFSSMRKELPPVAYINGSDLWMVVCMTFVFSSLFEFSVVKFMDHQFKKSLKKLKTEAGGRGYRGGGGQGPSKPSFGADRRGQRRSGKTAKSGSGSDGSNLSGKPLSRLTLSDLVLDHQTRINGIEKMARIVFPVTFGLWNAIYWPVLLLRKF